jgi:hypothetical protein
MEVISRKKIEASLVREGRVLSEVAKTIFRDSNLNINFPAIGCDKWEGFDISYSSDDCDILIGVEPEKKQIGVYDRAGLEDARRLQSGFLENNVDQKYTLVSYF